MFRSFYNLILLVQLFLMTDIIRKKWIEFSTTIDPKRDPDKLLSALLNDPILEPLSEKYYCFYNRVILYHNTCIENINHFNPIFFISVNISAIKINLYESAYSSIISLINYINLSKKISKFNAIAPRTHPNKENISFNTKQKLN